MKRYLWLGTGLLALSVAGCTSGKTTAPTTKPSSTTAPSASSTSAPSGPSTTSATPGTGASVPTLGRPAGDFAQGSQGFGAVRPTEIYNGGDPTGLVTHIVWRSWGGAQATGSGTSDYVGPDQDVASGTQETATVVAFDLGSCGGALMYQAVEWYFPQHGESFDPDTYENVCTGTYVPSP